MRLEVTCENRLGITQEVLDILVKRNIDLRGIETDPQGKIYLNFPEIEFSEFQNLMPEIRHIPGVDDVKTIAFMPSERGHFELTTLLKTLPDAVFSVDSKGVIILANDAASRLISAHGENIIGNYAGQYIKGFNIGRWLEADEVLAQTQRLRVAEEDFVADMIPVVIPEGDNEKTSLAGAVVNLKSESRLGEQVIAFRQPDEESFNHIQAGSTAMRRVIREAKKMALLNAPILIVGETGTGKELIAKACHKASERRDNAFLALNCASLPDNVAESELFGYGPNAFEGANSEGKKGIFEQADGGTVFLDEVGEMSPQLQSKLLRFLQDGSFRRIADDNEVKVEVRVICTTQSDLLELVQEGKFREDLYYRLNVLSLKIPPLRERKGDISGLAQHFIRRACQHMGRNLVSISEECMLFIQQYPWPGNVRQLENALFRSVSLTEGSELERENIHLPNYSSDQGYLDEEFNGTLDDAVKRYEAGILRKLYPAYPSTRQLAKKLGLSHTAIANKLRDYDINKKTVKV